MTDKTFQDYKLEMRDYLVQYNKELNNESTPGDIPTNERDIVGLLENLRRTFPKNPEPSDRIAMCYAYYHRSNLLMEEPYFKDCNYGNCLGCDIKIQI